MKDSIVHLTKIRTGGTSSSKVSEETLPKRPASFGSDYGMVGFGNCRTSYMESITGSSSGILPGDVVLPENGASTARNIRDTSAVLTPPMTPDRCRLPAIQHWNQIVHGCPELPEPLKIGETPLLEIPIPPPLAINKEGKDLPGIPTTGGRKVQRWEELDPPLFGAVKRASMRRRARSKNRAWDTLSNESRQVFESPSLRRFGELEARRSSARARKEKYRKKKSTESLLQEGLPFSHSSSYETIQPGSDAALGIAEAGETNLGHEGYRESIISAYARESTDQDSDYGEEERYLWKPLPKPPVENNWPLGRVEMP
ncbi:hypothetical protein TWF481_000016 [Arthrobotrys musiformis]|uniref:Uncharacterized protein n=1 Tax=Arthrobotrys musiformis TaxID=47236 RepID=A0AAV9WLD1_9PEZI